MLKLLFLPIIAHAGLFGPSKEELKKAVLDTVMAKFKYCVQEKKNKVGTKKTDLLLYEVEKCLEYGIENHKF